MTEPHNGLMTRGEVAAFTRFGLRTIDRWMQRGWLKYIKLPNGQIRFRRQDVINAMDRSEDEQFKSSRVQGNNDPSMG